MQGLHYGRGSYPLGGFLILPSLLFVACMPLQVQVLAASLQLHPTEFLISLAILCSCLHPQ
jgi:hypothetical protein